MNGVNKIIDGYNGRTLEIEKRKSVTQVVISGMEQIKAVEQTRLPPPFTHSDADAARLEKPKSRLFKIGMAGNISSKVLDATNERMILRGQTGYDLSINTVDAAGFLKLKNAAIVENSQVTTMHALEAA